METCEGFSIRGYASRMRSVDVVKCWPFGEATSEESVKSMLPLITVKKFTWWMDELQCLDSESSKILESSRKKKKQMKMVLERGESSSRSEDDSKHSDSDAMRLIMARSSNSKIRVPKKRSILEIFAVALPVERVSSEAEGDNVQEDDGLSDNSKLSGYGEINWGFKGKRKEKENKKIRKNKEVISSKLKRATKVMDKIKNTMTQKADDPPVHENEENGLMQKLQGQDIAIRNSDSSCMRKSGVEIKGRVSIYTKNLRRQHLDAAKNSMTHKAYKLTVQNQHPPGISKPGILKNHAKAFSKQQHTRRMLQEAFRVNHNGERKADKHVTFLERDNLLRQGRRPPQEECFKLQPCSASDMHNAQHLASGVGIDTTIVETSENEDVSNRTEDEWDGKRESKEQSTIACCPVDKRSISMNQCNKEGPLSRSVYDNTQRVFDVGICEMSCDPNYYNTQIMKVMANSPRSTGATLIKEWGTPAPRSPPVCKSYTEHSVSTAGKSASEMRQVLSRRTALDDTKRIENGPIPHLSPMVLPQTVSFLADGYREENICGKNIRGANEDFVGLPLNSKGELFTLNSNSRGSLNEMIRQNLITSPSISLSLPSNELSKCFSQHLEHKRLDCRICSSDKLSLFPSKGHSKVNSIVFAPSRLNMDVCRGNGTANLDLDLTKTIDHSFCPENSCCKEDNNVPKAYENEKILSTMCWMGKEFVVGRRGFHEFKDGHIWKDNRIMDELHFNNTSISNVMLHDQSEPSSGKLGETLFCPSEIPANQSSRSMPIFPHFNCETSSVHQTGSISRKINTIEQGLSPNAFSVVYNGEYSMPKPIQSGYESQICKFELPVVPAARKHPCPDVRSIDIRLIKKQNLPQSSRSAIQFPFMHPDIEGCFQPSCTPNSHMNQTPLSFDVSEDSTSMGNFQQQHHFSSSCHPCLIPGTNNWTDSSVPPKSRTSHAYDSFSLGSTMRSPIGVSSSPISLTQQAAALSCPRIFPISSVRERHGIQNIRERIKSRITIRDFSHGRQAKNHPLAVSNVSFKTVKTTSLRQKVLNMIFQSQPLHKF